MARVARILAAATFLTFAGPIVEMPSGDALAQAAKPIRAKKAKPVPRRASVRPPSPPAGATVPGATVYDRSTAGSGGGY
jgi:hypothetical protein